MNSKHIAIAVSLLVAWSGGGFASAASSQGVISFHGSIVETPCTVSGSGKGLILSRCPTVSRGSFISVRDVEPKLSVSALAHSIVKVKRVVKSGEDGKLNSQHYALVGADGGPVNSGKYVITLTFP